jgi:hypothetical protein
LLNDDAVACVQSSCTAWVMHGKTKQSQLLMIERRSSAKYDVTAICAPAAPNGPKLSILQGFRGDREKGDDATENPENIVNMMKEGGSSSAKHLAIANELD